MDKNMQSLDKNVPNYLGKKRYLERTEEISTPDILRKFKVDRSDPKRQYCFKSKYLYENLIASFPLIKGGMLYKESDIHFVYIPDGHNFLIKKIDGREVKADEDDVEYMKEEFPCDSLSYAEINKGEVNISEVFIDRKGYGADRLGEMLQEYVRLENDESKYDDLNEDEDDCIKLEEKNENKKERKSKRVKNKNVKNNDFGKKEDKSCFDHDMDIDGDFI